METKGAVQTSGSALIGPLPKDQHSRLKKAAQAMEAQWFQNVMNEASTSMGNNDSYATQTFKGMLNETLASRMSETGALGMADLLVRQLQSNVPAETAPATGQESAPPSTTPVDGTSQESIAS